LRPKKSFLCTLPSFKKLVPASHIVFGTDFPQGGGSGLAVSQGLIDNKQFREVSESTIRKFSLSTDRKQVNPV